MERARETARARKRKRWIRGEAWTPRIVACTIKDTHTHEHTYTHTHTHTHTHTETHTETQRRGTIKDTICKDTI
jgi:hypothetical protein